jgi:hypothetical protein
MSAEIAKHLRISVRNADNFSACIDAYLCDRLRFDCKNSPIEVGNGVSVRAELRVVQFRNYSFLKSLRDEVFQPLRLVMYFIPEISKDLMQGRHDQPVVANDLKDAVDSSLRQSNPITLS